MDYRLEDVISGKREYMIDISLGGMQFRSGIEIGAGSLIQVSVPIENPVYELLGRVVWARRTEDHWYIGLEFLSPDGTYRTHLLETVCRLENYKYRVLKSDGRLVSGEQAALEWNSLASGLLGMASGKVGE